MSSSTWTPVALSSEARPLSGVCWRLVEAQHHVSTLKLVDSLGEQQLLEDLIEDSKPPVPPECRHLHYLLSTPFRYGTAYPNGSRFRRAGLTDGVFYAVDVPVLIAPVLRTVAPASDWKSGRLLWEQIGDIDIGARWLTFSPIGRQGDRCPQPRRDLLPDPPGQPLLVSASGTAAQQPKLLQRAPKELPQQSLGVWLTAKSLFRNRRPRVSNGPPALVRGRSS
jgi:hypothetical protein